MDFKVVRGHLQGLFKMYCARADVSGLHQSFSKDQMWEHLRWQFLDGLLCVRERHPGFVLYQIGPGQYGRATGIGRVVLHLLAELFYGSVRIRWKKQIPVKIM